MMDRVTPAVAEDPRARYHHLLDGRQDAGFADAEPPLDATFADVESFWGWLHERRARPEPAPAMDARDVLLAYAPTAVLDGCWLAPLGSVRFAHDTLGSACLEAHFLECGNGDAAHHHGNLYRALLASRGIALRPHPSEGFATDPRLRDDDFVLALSSLALATCAPARLPEALGFHAASCVLGPPGVVLDAAHDTSPGSFFAAHEFDGEIARRARALARRALDAYGEQTDAAVDGLVRGASRYLRSRDAWLATLVPAPERSPKRAMVALVASKAAHAVGFHRKVRLLGRTLDSWLGPGGDAEQLVEALASSPWIVPGKPEQSTLLTRATQFGGPMFGVFTDAELATIRVFVESLSDPERTSVNVVVPGKVTKITPKPPFVPPRGRGAVRTLFHDLLNGAQDAETTKQAHGHVQRLLERAARTTSRRALTDAGLLPWSRARFEQWVFERLREQIDVERGETKVERAIVGSVTRKEVVWLLTQLAPSAFTDGAWLEGVRLPALAHTPMAAPLLRIHRDELGAGIPHQHHGNVLRRTLKSENVTLPACASRDFAEHACFVSEAFSMPVLWLSIARTTPSFVPELLGLNLAIEMAGIGSAYETAIALLKRHDIDPYFFELHNTIDNGATGHTAWSSEAIIAYVDAIAELGDEDATAMAVERIFTGHAAYGLASRPFTRVLAAKLGPRVALRLLRAGISGAWPLGRG